MRLLQYHALKVFLSAFYHQAVPGKLSLRKDRLRILDLLAIHRNASLLHISSRLRPGRSQAGFLKDRENINLIPIEIILRKLERRHIGRISAGKQGSGGFF